MKGLELMTFFHEFFMVYCFSSETSGLSLAYLLKCAHPSRTYCNRLAEGPTELSVTASSSAGRQCLIIPLLSYWWSLRSAGQKTLLKCLRIGSCGVAIRPHCVANLYQGSCNKVCKLEDVSFLKMNALLASR